MTIETYCKRCNRTISTLLTLSGILHPDNILELDIDDNDLTCGICYETDASALRVIGGTVAFNCTKDEAQP